MEFAFVPRLGLVESVGRYRELLAPQSAAALGASADGWSIASEAANGGYTATVQDVSRFTGPVTFLWRGVVTGNHTGDAPALVGVYYGNGLSSPFYLAYLGRPSSGNNDGVSFNTNTGAGSASGATPNIGLSSLYGIPIAIACSHSVGDANAIFAVATPTGVTTYTSSLSAGSSATRASTGSDVLAIGTYPGASTRFTNTRTTLAAGWSRAMPMSELVSLANSPWAMFEGPRSILPMADSASPPAEIVQRPTLPRSMRGGFSVRDGMRIR